MLTAFSVVMIVKQSLESGAPALLWIPDQTWIAHRNIMTGQKYNDRTENQSGTGAPDRKSPGAAV
ncbi:MAG: hypothetical protein WCI51_02430 [Lentisphaerota bacterium]